MSEVSTVLTKAKVLSAEARRVREGEAGAAELARVSNALKSVQVRVASAGDVAQSYRTCQTHGLGLRLGISMLDEGRARLAAQATLGLPPDRAFVAARGKLEESTARLSEEIAIRWREWGSARAGEVPQERIALLDEKSRAMAGNSLAALSRLTEKRLPTEADFTQFDVSLRQLEDLLDDLRGVPEEVLELLRRLGAHPALVLSDLSDDDVERLRAAGVADQVEVRRRGFS